MPNRKSRFPISHSFRQHSGAPAENHLMPDLPAQRFTSGEYLFLFPGLQTQSGQDFSFCFLPAGYAFLDPSNRQLRYPCLSRKLGFTDQQILSHLFQSIRNQEASSKSFA
jgi:hypothetical protein